MNLLFICSRNQWRSPTAEALYRNRQGFRARSAGTEPSARTRVTAGMLTWADRVFVMEKKHRQRLQDRFPEETAEHDIIVLDIPDEYHFMDEELVLLLEAAIEPYLGSGTL